MKRLVLSVAVALVVTFVAVPDALTLVTTGHPPRCSYANGVGNFCVTWNPTTGQYNPAPAGVGADFSRAAPDDGDTALLAAYAAAVFVAVTVTAWLVLMLAASIRRTKPVEPSAADSPAEAAPPEGAS